MKGEIIERGRDKDVEIDAAIFGGLKHSKMQPA